MNAPCSPTKIVLFIWFAILAFSHGADHTSEIASLPELLKLLATAQTLDIEGSPPPDPKKMVPAATYPIHLSGRAQIQPIADLFRSTRFRRDDFTTDVFRRGGAISSNIYTVITIDGKHSCEVFSSSLLVFDNNLTYRADEFQGIFHTEMALLVTRISDTAREHPKPK